MKKCLSCGSYKFNKLGNVKVIEHGDFGKNGRWESAFTELVWDEYVFNSYICDGCGKSFYNEEVDKPQPPLFWHPV